MEDISERGTEAVVPLPKRIVYKMLVVESETSVGKGMSITVPARRMLVKGSIHSTRVPGGYFSSKEGLSSQWREQKRPPSYVTLE